MDGGCSNKLVKIMMINYFKRKVIFEELHVAQI